MLKVYMGGLENEIYNPDMYFNNQYEDKWITDELAKAMIADVDKSVVISSHVIDSPVLGAITPKELSGGVKTLMLLAFDTSGNIFNGSACGDNCAKWILKLAEDKDITITLHHGMRFGAGPFEIEILNNGKIVRNRHEWLENIYNFI